MTDPTFPQVDEGSSPSVQRRCLVCGKTCDDRSVMFNVRPGGQEFDLCQGCHAAVASVARDLAHAPVGEASGVEQLRHRLAEAEAELRTVKGYEASVYAAEERRAWDLYAAATLAIYGVGNHKGAANEADLVLAERRKRFPPPGGETERKS